MPIFAKSETQAVRAMRLLSPQLKSVGTNRNYMQALKVFCDHLKSTVGKTADLLKATPEQAQSYLQERAQKVSQKTLDMDRQALQHLLQATGALKPGDKLKNSETGHIEKSAVDTVLRPRAYFSDQVAAICAHQTEPYALSTQIAYCAGLRAHELLTLQRYGEKPVTERPGKPNEQRFGADRFAGREDWARYIVTGKGGHVREVRLTPELARQLEARRLPEPERVRDRRVFYEKRYAIPGGQRWSNSFSQASKKALGRSTGAHGLRHSYAQDRLTELQKIGRSLPDAQAIVSLEMGHYRETITEVYLR